MRFRVQNLLPAMAFTAMLSMQLAWASPATNFHGSRGAGASQAAGHKGTKGGLTWNSVSAGFAQAKKKKKPIVVDFFTDWCGWCKVMDETTFHDPAVKKTLASQFILVKANAEDGGDGQKLSKTLLVSGYPTTVLCDFNGKPQMVMVGFIKPDKFAANLDEFLGKSAGSKSK